VGTRVAWTYGHLGWASLALTGVLGIACGDGSGSAASDGSSVTTDTASDAGASVPYTPEPQTPRWTAGDVAGELSRHLPAAVPDIVQLLEAYLWMMGNGDEECPGSTTQLTAVDPELGCTAETGFWYYGVASYVDFEEGDWRGRILSGDFELRGPEGDALSCGGHVSLEWVEESRVGRLLGTWQWSAAEDSLAEPVSASLVIEHTGITEDGPPEVMRLDGGLTTEEGSWVFDDFMFLEGCQGRPTGELSLYDPARMHWYRLVLDKDCSGCGRVLFWDGTRLGRACPDWSGMSEHLTDAHGSR